MISGRSPPPANRADSNCGSPLLAAHHLGCAHALLHTAIIRPGSRDLSSEHDFYFSAPLHQRPICSTSMAGEKNCRTVPMEGETPGRAPPGTCADSRCSRPLPGSTCPGERPLLYVPVHSHPIIERLQREVNILAGFQLQNGKPAHSNPLLTDRSRPGRVRRTRHLPIHRRRGVNRRQSAESTGGPETPAKHPDSLIERTLAIHALACLRATIHPPVIPSPSR